MKRSCNWTFDPGVLLVIEGVWSIGSVGRLIARSLSESLLQRQCLLLFQLGPLNGCELFDHLYCGCTTRMSIRGPPSLFASSVKLWVLTSSCLRWSPIQLPPPEVPAYPRPLLRQSRGIVPQDLSLSLDSYRRAASSSLSSSSYCSSEPLTLRTRVKQWLVYFLQQPIRMGELDKFQTRKQFNTTKQS